MTAKEKANDIYQRMHNVIVTPSNKLRRSRAKEASIICVDEVMKSITWSQDFNDEKRKYWQEVKQEIEKL